MQARLVQRIPLDELWRGPSRVEAMATMDLGAEDVRRLLKGGPRQFVVADVGLPYHWIPKAESFQFWKSEVRAHLAEGEVLDLAQLQGEYAIRARLWVSGDGEGIIVIEKHH